MEGPMGVGKTTFSRTLLLGLGVVQPPEGSPTFAIAHEYHAPGGDVVHVDFYRLKSEAEIEAAGIDAYFWERGAIVISEWTSLFPDFEAALNKPSGEARNWRVKLSFGQKDSERDIEIRMESV
jgi:tRNA threonylcarbamoyl adenosine modification protein YjeE